MKRTKTTRHQRVALRRLVGPLQLALVKPKTQELYNFSLALWGLWRLGERLPWPEDEDGLDDELSLFAEAAWQEGETKATVDNLISGIKLVEPRLQFKLRGVLRLMRAWKKKEVTAKCAPMTLQMLKAMVGLCFAWGWLEEAALLWLGYKCILRTGELFAVLVVHLQLDLDNLSGILDLPDTKTTFRKGTAEAVTITDPALVIFLAFLNSSRAPGETLYRGTPSRFRKRFSQLAAALKMDHLYLLPYSLRRGGATQYFLETGSLDKTAVRGRWQNVKTCRVYVDEALRDKARMQIPDLRLLKRAVDRFEEVAEC